MPRHEPASDPVSWRWAAAAQRRLAPVLDAASRLRAAFDAGPDATLVEPVDPATELVAACDGLLQWIHGSPAPGGHERAEAELGAALAVFRNAAFVFRSLDEVDPDQRAARAEACRALLVQGEHHLDLFLSMSGSDPRAK